MTYPLPVDTAHVRPRTRQYRLMKWDLGEGIERSVIKVGAAAAGAWLAVCWLAGLPLNGHLIMVWVLPPALFTYYSSTRDESGRLRLRSWVDRADGLRPARRRPIVNGGTGPTAPPPPIEADIEFLVLDLPATSKEPTGALPAA